MADDDLSIDFSINPELSLQQLLAQGELIQEVLQTAAKRAATQVDREFAGLGQRQLELLAKRARDAFEDVRDASGKTKTQIRNDLRNFNALFADLTRAIAAVGDLGFGALAAASKKANKELAADSKARTAQLDAEVNDARKVRLAGSLAEVAIAKDAAKEVTRVRATEARNASSVLAAADKAVAQAAGKILVEEAREASKERLRIGEAAAAKARQLALEEAKTVGKIQRDALNDQRDAIKRSFAEVAADKRRQISEDKRLADQTTEAARVAIRDRQSAERRGHLDSLEAARAANRLELAEEKGHQFRKSEVLKTGLDLLRTQVRNFVIRRREDQRTADRLEVIDQERKAAQSVATKQSELRQVEALSRASLARQAATQRAQTISSQGVTGAALGRSTIGIGTRNLALAGGGILSARSTFTIGADFVGALRVAQTQLKLTDAEMKRMRDTSIDLGKAMDLPGVSAKDAAESMLQLAKAGLTVDQTLSAARGTLQLGRAVNADFAESAFQVGVALNVFDIEAQNATKVADIMAKTVALAGGTSFNDLTLAIRQSAAVFALNQKDVLGADKAYALLNATLATLAKNGLTGSDAGTSLKQMILALTAPSSVQSKIMDELGERIGVTSIAYDSATKKARPFNEVVRLLSKSLQGLTQEQRDAALGDLFGSDAVRAGAILANSADDLDKAFADIVASQRTATTKGFAELLAGARNKGLRGALDVLRSQIETFQILLFEKLERPIQIAVLALAKGLDALANSKSFAAIREGLKIVAIAVAGLLIAKAAAEALQLLSLAVKTLAFSPFGLFTVGVLGAAFAIGYFASKNKEFGEQLAILTGKLALLGPLLLKDLVQGDIKAAADHLIEILKLIGNFPLVQLVRETITNAGKLVVNTAVSLGRAIADGVVAGFELAKDLGPKVLEAVRNAVESVGTSAVALGKTILEKIGDGIALARDNKIPQKIGALIVQGIFTAGQLLADALSNEIVIKTVVAVAAGLGAAAVVIVGSFVAGFVAGLVQNRGEIASALADILRFAVNLALPVLKEAILKSPVWAQILLGLAAIFVGAKIFGGLLTSFNGFRTNLRAGMQALGGDFAGAKKTIHDFNTEARATTLKGANALGSGFPGFAAGLRKDVINPAIAATAALTNLERKMLTLNATGMPVTAAPRQLTLPFLPNRPETGQLTLNNLPPQGQMELFPRGRTAAAMASTNVSEAGLKSSTLFDGEALSRQQRIAAGAQEDFNRKTRQTRSAADQFQAGIGIMLAGLSAYSAAASTGATRTISIIGSLSTIGLAFAQGGPVMGSFAIAAAGVGAALGAQAKRAAEAKARLKDYIAILREADAATQRQAIVDRLTKQFDDGGKAAKFFFGDLKGNASSFADAIQAGQPALEAYLAALIKTSGAEIGFDQKVHLANLLKEGKAYEDAAKHQKVLQGAIGNSKDAQARLTALSELDAKNRKDALDAQKEFLALVASNEQGVIGLALGLESRFKQQAAIASAPAEEQARLRLELEQTDRLLAGDFVRGVEEAITAAKQLGVDPITAVENYKNALRDKLTNPDTGLGLAKVTADELIAKLDALGGKQVKTAIEIQIIADTEAAKKKMAELWKTIQLPSGGFLFPEMLGQEGWTVPVPNAKGSIVRREQIVRVGEGGKPEVIIPLTDPMRAVQLAAQSGLLRILADSVKDRATQDAFRILGGGQALGGASAAAFGPELAALSGGFRGQLSAPANVSTITIDQIMARAAANMGRAVTGAAVAYGREVGDDITFGAFEAAQRGLLAQPLEVQVDIDTSRAQRSLDAFVETNGFGSGLGLGASGAIAEGDRSFAASVAAGLDTVITGGALAGAANAAAAGAQTQGAPLIGVVNVNEVAGDPVATGIVAGSIIAGKIQGALH